MIGPATDRWGTWITVLLPIIDPKTSAIVAVFGMDYDSTQWNWDVVYFSALPAGLILLTFLCLIFIIWTVHTMSVETKPVLGRLFLPLTMILVFLIGFGAYLFWNQHNKYLSNCISENIDEISRNFCMAMYYQKHAIETTIHSLAANQIITTALANKDVSTLLKECTPVFNTLKQEYHINYFCFHDPNRFSILRLHHFN